MLMMRGKPWFKKGSQQSVVGPLILGPI